MGDDTIFSSSYLNTRNKFIRQIENCPKHKPGCVVLPWSLTDKQFETSSFHPRKVHYRINLDELSRVWPYLPGVAVSSVDAELSRVQQSAVAGAVACDVHGSVPVPDIQGAA
jgi:hypothetical protein